MNLATLAEESVRRYGEYPALAFEGRELTNVDQQRAASRFAHALRRLGVAPGDRVVVMLPNCPEVLQAYAAILKAGAVVVPVIFLLVAVAAIGGGLPALLVYAVGSLIAQGATPWIAAVIVGLPIFIVIMAIPLAVLGGLVRSLPAAIAVAPVTWLGNAGGSGV